VTAKLMGQCGLTTDELYELLLSSWLRLRAAKWCLNEGRLSLVPRTFSGLGD